MEVEYQWTPNRKVGPFVFGTQIDYYISKYKLELVPEEFDKDAGWVVYGTPADDRIYVECGKINTVSCYLSCIYNGEELIGRHIDIVLKYFNTQPYFIDKIEMPDGPQDVYEFDQLGLQLWVEDGIVVTAIVSDSES